ncbi:MAG: hypothetical protein Q9201_005019 [Fulgogasparrea decipioides]
MTPRNGPTATGTASLVAVSTTIAISGHQVQLATRAYGARESCAPLLERDRVFCCDPTGGRSPFLPVPLDHLFPYPPEGDDVDTGFDLKVDNSWGDGKPDTPDEEPNDSSFGFVVITSPEELQVSLDKRDGSHWELFNFNDAVSEEEQTVQMAWSAWDDTGNAKRFWPDNHAELHKRWFGSDAIAWLKGLFNTNIKPKFTHNNDTTFTAKLIDETWGPCKVGGVDVEAKLLAQALASVKVGTGFGFTLITKLSLPLDLSQSYLYFKNKGDVSATFTLDAVGKAKFGTGDIEIAGLENFPGATFGIPKLLTVGPNFKLVGAVDAEVTLSGHLESKVQIASWDIQQTYPDQGAEWDPKGLSNPNRDGTGSFEGIKQPTLDYSVTATGQITAHLKPTFEFGIVFNKMWKVDSAKVDVIADGWVRMKAAAGASSSGNCPFTYVTGQNSDRYATEHILEFQLLTIFLESLNLCSWLKNYWDPGASGWVVFKSERRSPLQHVTYQFPGSDSAYNNEFVLLDSGVNAAKEGMWGENAINSEQTMTDYEQQTPDKAIKNLKDVLSALKYHQIPAVSTLLVNQADRVGNMFNQMEMTLANRLKYQRANLQAEWNICIKGRADRARTRAESYLTDNIKKLKDGYASEYQR